MAWPTTPPLPSTTFKMNNPSTNLKQSFFELDQNQILASLEHALDVEHQDQRRCTGRMLALNSVENRVYAFDTEDGQEYVAKFYRPGRWSQNQLLEEHQFLSELHEAEVPVIPPIQLKQSNINQRTLAKTQNGIYFCIFSKVRGRLKDELNTIELEILARFVARIHVVGSQKDFTSRPELNIDNWLWDSVDLLDENDFSNNPMAERYLQLVEESANSIGTSLQSLSSQRVHGDCHCGNVLWNDAGAFFTDFDDCMQGPPVQDLWMILRGRGLEEEKRRETFVKAYEEIRPFDHSSLESIEALRVLRMVYYNSWIAKRWDDPSFQKLFPSFGRPEWWQEEIQALTECIEALHGSST